MFMELYICVYLPFLLAYFIACLKLETKLVKKAQQCEDLIKHADMLLDDQDPEFFDHMKSWVLFDMYDLEEKKEEKMAADPEKPLIWYVVEEF